MRSEGYSLLETMFIVAIVAILAVIGTLQFREYLQRYRTEAQTRLLFTELLKARTQAIYQHRRTRVKLYADRFAVYSSLQDSSTVTPVQTHSLNYRLTSKSDLAVGQDIDFDETGITYDWCSVCLEDSAGAGGVDSVVIAATRVSIGKKDKGNVCESDSITLK
ncbi:pilus assembly FimT family protein [Geomonas propionica]|uniref:Pilus assembly protein PylG n=1 Tax=Geomonas propionica TaxID=2798582 RepID=A0ABS0YVC3_9BACT|nr:pilus assembly protein PylG [Geomonas propionica]MBJ6801876.1 pilus assembly protein PylG [Geomonas propionica]